MNADRIEEITEELIPLQTRLDFIETDSESRDNEYIAYLDEIYPEEIEVGGTTFKVSKILKNCSSETDWRLGRNDCFQEETETLSDQINDLYKELEAFESVVAGSMVSIISLSDYAEKISSTNNRNIDKKNTNYCIHTEDTKADYDDVFCTIYIKLSDFYFVKTRVKKGIKQKEINKLAKIIYETL